MKIYAAIKFSIVIVPPKLSEKTKESKLLVRSFRHIYKVAGLAIATSISGLLSLSQLQQERKVPIDDTTTRQFAIEESSKSFESAESITSDESAESIAASAPMEAESESQDFAQHNLEIAKTMAESDASSTIDLLVPLLIITGILGCFTIYYLWKINNLIKSDFNCNSFFFCFFFSWVL